MSHYAVTLDTSAGTLTVRVRTFGPDWRAIATHRRGVGRVGKEAQAIADLYHAEITAALRAEGVLP